MRSIQQLEQQMVQRVQSIGSCPVLHPSEQDFKSFYEFVSRVEQEYSGQFGMVKIVPPKGWRARRSDYGPSISKLIVKNPIEQNSFGKGGAYECLLIQKKSMTVGEYRARVEPFEKPYQRLGPNEVEAKFWKSLNYSPPLYGADIRMSLMEDCAGPWQLSKLSSVLSRGLSHNIDGVNTPYCYIGSWKSFFCWHTEDLELAAINYLHMGKSKFWYSLPATQKQLLQSQVRKYFNQSSTRCGQFLRHKTFIVNPYVLKEKCPELKISKVEHKAGEFTIVFGGSYHCGFNFGFNIAEAVNFATLHWLKMLPNSQICQCRKDSVKIDMHNLARRLKQSDLGDSTEVQSFAKTATAKQQRKPKIAKESVLWAQCDQCEIWRRLPRTFKVSNEFYCEDVNQKCPTA